MSGRRRRDCPVCHKQGLLRLPNHLRDMHGLDPQSVMETASVSESEVSESDIDVDDTDSVDSSNDNEEEDTTESEEDEDDDEVDEDDPWVKWVEDVFQQYEEPMKERMAELMNDTEMSKGDAQDAVLEEFLPRMNHELQHKLVDFSHLRHHFKSDPTYTKIMETAKRGRMEEDMDWEESLTYAAEVRKLLLYRILQKWAPKLDDEDSSEDSD